MFNWLHLRMSREPQQQPENDSRNECQENIERQLAWPCPAPLFPIAKFRPVGNSHLIGMLQIVREFARRGIAVLRIGFQSAVNNFLQRWRNIRFNFTWWYQVVQQPVIHE